MNVKKICWSAGLADIRESSGPSGICTGLTDRPTVFGTLYAIFPQKNTRNLHIIDIP